MRCGAICATKGSRSPRRSSPPARSSSKAKSTKSEWEIGDSRAQKRVQRGGEFLGLFDHWEVAAAIEQERGCAGVDAQGAAEGTRCDVAVARAPRAENGAGVAREAGPVFCAWGTRDRYIAPGSLRSVLRVYPRAP